MLVDGGQLLVQQILSGVKMLLPRLRHCPLRGSPPLEHGGPQQEAPALILDVPTLLTEHVMRLIERLAHGANHLIEGDIPWCPQRGVPQDSLRLHHDVVVSARRG
jgi:hypothetical protein